MKKNGWQEGQGLGKKLQGRADPLQVNFNLTIKKNQIRKKYICFRRK